METDDRQRATEILRRLRQELKIDPKAFVSLWTSQNTQNPFAVLLATILSQSCTDKAALQAFGNLKKRIGISPTALTKAKLSDIQSAIRFAGLQKTKARGIKELAKAILTRYGGDIGSVLTGDIEEARKKLIELPKVGPKTADVLLVTFANKPVIPVDTHINRVAVRLGFAKPKSKYEDVRRSLESVFPLGSFHDAHLLLIAHGRRFCQARKPRCYECPILDLCPYPYKMEKLNKAV